MNEKEGMYKGLGKQLKVLRTRAKESLAEASGAVEIDVKQLASFELGQARPTEDVLMLLISHFGARDDEAIRLWELAGYGNSSTNPSQSLEINLTNTDDNKILFTDVVDVTVNNYGVVMNFMQGAGPNKEPSSIARVGMSREHAKSVLQILQLTLSQTEVSTKDLTNQSTNQSEAKNS
jgi:transcriptional regulator with XRE-family HTH domain